MLAGLEPLDEGRILIAERDVSAVRPRDRDIAMVFQNYALYPQLDVAANMGFALKQQGVPKEERRQRVARGREAARPRALPRPQAAQPLGRPAPARRHGARHRPAPAGLPDGRAALQPRREAARADAHRARRAAVAPGGHDRLRDPRPGRGDDDGRTAWQCCATASCSSATRPSTLYHAPANLFVAGFIGSPAMNQLHVSATGPLLIGGADVGIADDLGGERATVGFRPEAVVVGTGPIAARIRVVEDLGSEVFVHLVIQHEGEEQPARRQGRRPVRGRGRRQRADRAARHRASLRHVRRAAQLRSPCDGRSRYRCRRRHRRRHRGAAGVGGIGTWSWPTTRVSRRSSTAVRGAAAGAAAARSAWRRST